MNIKRSLLLGAILALSCAATSAQTNIYDGKPLGLYQFTFPPGTDLVGQAEPNGLTWAAAGPAGPQITIAPNSLVVPALASPAGNRARLGGVNGPAARIGLDTNLTSGTVYYSLALKVADLGTLGPNGGTLTALNDAVGPSPNLPAPIAARLLLRSSADGYQLGVSKSSTNENNFVWDTSTFTSNDIVFVVASYEFTAGPGNDIARLWINPGAATFDSSNAPAPTLTTSTGGDIDAIRSFVLVQRPQPILPAVSFVDEVRLGTNWASVTPPAVADLAVSVGSLPAQLQEGELLTVPVTVSDLGPDVATGVQLNFSLPEGAVLESLTNDHGSYQVQGSNVTCSVLALPPQQSFNVEAVFSVDPQFAGQTGEESFDWDLLWLVNAAQRDPNTTNNQVLGILPVFPKLDFGDARAPYPVTRAEKGARHRDGSVYHLGLLFDRETNGVHSANADADDLRGLADEDGVSIPSPLLAGGTYNVMVTASVAGYLDAFFDFNNDGDWADPGERVTPAGGLAIGPGTVPVAVTVPIGAVTGSPHARFRFSDVGGLAPTGFYPVGEVEDYQIEIRRVDFGNAPDPIYPTLLASDGARHIVDPAWHLGASEDWEPDGLDSPGDADGVVFLTPLTPGATATVQVTASIAGMLDAFIDFDGDGVWTERITLPAGTPLVAGTNLVSFPVPAAATPKTTWARFRFSDVGGLGPTGPANIGEVEDYEVNIAPASPPVIVFGGLEHSATGNVTFSVSSNALTIANLNTSNDTVRINLGSAGGWRADVGQWAPSNAAVNVSAIGSVGGQSNQPLYSVRMERAGSNVVLSADFAGVGASEYVAQFYDQGGGLLSSRTPSPNGTSFPIGLCADSSGQPGLLVCHTEVLADSTYIRVCDCVQVPGIVGDIPGGVIVKLSAADATATPDYAGAVEFAGPGTASVTLSGEALFQSGLWHQAVGQAHFAGALTEIGEDLEVFNLDTNGLSGISTEFGDQAAVDVKIPNCPCEPNPSCCATTAFAFRMSLDGTANGAATELASLALAGTGQAADLSGSFVGSGAATATLEMRNGGQVITSIPVTDGDWGMLTAGSNQPVEVDYCTFVKVDSNRVSLRIQFAGPVTLNYQGGGQFNGTHLRLDIANSNAVLDTSSGGVTLGSSEVASAHIWSGVEDYGDAPDPNYPTKAASDGARHRVWWLPVPPLFGSWYLGSKPDWEPDAHANYNATGDDTDGNDDEDGVSIGPGFTEGATVTVTVTASQAGYLDGWIDYNGNGSWDDAGEKIFDSIYLSGGTTNLSFTAKTYTSPDFFGLATFARFRFSKDGGLGPIGLALTGEVEDYQVNIFPYSFPFAGIDQSTLGNATATVISNELHVSNLGSSGEDGVAVELEELSRTAQVQFAPVDLGTSGSSLAFSLFGMVNDVPGQFFGTLSLQRSGGAVELSLDSGPEPLASMVEVEVYNDSALVGSTSVASGGVLGILSGDVQPNGISAGDEQPSDTAWSMWDVDFSAPVNFQPTGSSENYSGNRIRIVALNPTGILQNLLRVEVTGQNLDSLVIKDESAPQFEPRLRIAEDGERLKLNWDTRSAVLLRASSVNGPWSRVLDGTNSAEITPAIIGPRFYRAEIDRDLSATLALGNRPLYKRNILLLIPDDVGVDKIPAYIDYYAGTASTADDIDEPSTAGNPKLRLDTLDRLIESGVMFLNAWSSPSCSPTRAGLYTGNYSFRKVNGVYSPLKPDLLYPTTTIADQLSDKGYTCALFGKWHLGKRLPTDFGWEHFAGARDGGIDSYYSWTKYVSDYDKDTGTSSTSMSTCTEYATTNNVNDALEWISTNTGPWMVTIAFNAPHSALGTDPYEAPPPGWVYSSRTDTSKKAIYRSMLECLDLSVSNLLARMDPDVLEKTTIIFVTDNGTAQDITDHFTESTFPSYGTTNHAKGSVYEGGVGVGLVISDGYRFLHPSGYSPFFRLGDNGRIKSPGRVETNLVQTLDIFATCAALGHASSCSGQDSVSMVPYLKSDSASAKRDWIFMENRPSWFSAEDTWVCGTNGWDLAIRNATYKLVVHDFGYSSVVTWELYNLSSDRWESTILSTWPITLYAHLIEPLHDLLDSGSADCP